MQRYVRRSPDGTILRGVRYTREEIRSHWHLPDNTAIWEPAPAKAFYLVHEIESEDAVEIAALWLRRVCPLPTSHKYLTEQYILVLHTGAMPDRERAYEHMGAVLTAHRAAGLDDCGPLFAPPDEEVEVDGIALAKALFGLRSKVSPDDRAKIDEVLSTAYLGQ